MKSMATAFLLALLCCATVHAQPAPAPQPWGTILGRVVYDGKGKIPAPRMMPIKKALPPGAPAAIEDESLVVGKNSELANVMVFLRTKPAQLHPGYVNAPPQQQRLSSENYRFKPHVLMLWTNDELEAVNANPARGHNFNYSSPAQGFNLLLAPGGRATKKLQANENLPQHISCNIHPWMSAKLLVRDNPYFCMTDERGIFCIPNLPTNQVLEFVFWHERCGYMNAMANQAPNPAHNTVLNKQGRMYVRLVEPVLDLGEFLADPKKLEQ
jgi:hypothetical protein